MSKLFVDEIVHQSSQGSGTITLGASGEKITTASGAEFSNITGQNYPAFAAYTNSDLSLSNNVRTLAKYDTEVFDSHSAFDNTASNYKFTVPTGYDGKYFFFASAHILGSNDGQFRYAEILFRINDASYYGRALDYFDGNPVRGATPSISVIFDLVAGDYVQVHVRGHVTANTCSLQGGVNEGKFHGYRIGT